MKIVVVGGGSIGSYLAALLSLGGNDVTLVCRGAQFDAVNTRGLVVKRGAQARHAHRLAVSQDASDLDEADVVVMAVKLYDLAASSRQIRRLIGPDTLVVPVQNGVTAHEIIEREIGAGHAVGGTVFLSAALEAPGIVVSRSSRDQFTFGELDGIPSSRALAFKDACVRSGILAELSDRILSHVWEKYVATVGTSAVCCLARQSVGYVRSDERLTACWVRAMDEAVTVAKFLNITVAPDTIDRVLAFGATVTYDARISMLEDIDAGKPTELEWLSGHLVRVADAAGIDVPVHSLAFACLSQYARGTKSNASAHLLPDTGVL